MKLLESYPYNFVFALFGDEEEALKVSPAMIKSVLSSIDNRSARILVYRFRDGYTLEAIGDLEGVTKERIRQIEAKSLAKLRRAESLAHMVSYTLDDLIKRDEEHYFIRKENDRLKEIIDMYMNHEISAFGLKELAKVANVMHLPIKQMDFSVRLINCLTRAGLETLQDISELSLVEVSKIRNLGAKTTEELFQWLDHYNIKLK